MSQQPDQPNNFNDLYTYYSRLYDFVVVELDEAKKSGLRVQIARHEAHRDLLDNVLTHFERLLFTQQPGKKPTLRLISGGKTDNNQQEKKPC